MTLVAYSWGYEGWGSSTRELAKVTAEVEAARGRRPPLFVDVRYRRSVRAAGFRERAFEELLGPARYRHLRGLGNRAIADPAARAPVEIDKPDAVEELLRLVREERRRRVIFFCACGSPLEARRCHRFEVARLLLAHAQARGMKLAVEEWPGGVPVRASLSVAREVVAAIRRGTRSFSMPDLVPGRVAAGLPHFSLLRLLSGEDGVIALSGAAIRQGGGWRLPVHDFFELDEERAALAQARTSIRELALAPRGAPVDRARPWRTFLLGARQDLHPEAVYAIRHPDALDKWTGRARPVEFRERKRWIGAREILGLAARPVPILFADATWCARVTHWGLLRAVSLDSASTVVRVSDVRRLPRVRSQQDLVLRGTRRPIADGFIRSYALIETPGFLPAE